MQLPLKAVLLGAVAVLILGAGYLSLMQRQGGLVGQPQACSQEAKVCPDGTAVGRTGPNCSFAPCPATSTTTAQASTDALAIGEQATINGTLISVLGLTEDSRCPVDVQCIQAGTVRVRAALNAYNRDFTFTLGVPQSVDGASITLSSVLPAQKHSTLTVAASDYRFVFTVIPRDSGVRGSVSMGPTCPVERDPPDPACADRPYSTSISISHNGATFAVAQSALDGTYSIALPPGAYTLHTTGNKMLRCAPVDVVVPAAGYVRADISCDTGIR